MADEAASRFRYDPGLLGAYGTIRAGVVHATGLVNGPSPEALLEDYAAAQRQRADALRETPVSELPSIAAWRRVFTRFGARPTQHRNAAEALLRRLDKQGEIPSLSALVDLGNLVSIRHALPVAVFDVDHLAGAITVRAADGTEPFADLGASETAHPEPGEVVFVDEAGVVCARRWCWRQSAASATRPDTTEALFVIEGHHEGADHDVSAATAELEALLAAHQPGGRVSTTMLP